jgi:hypothetical protein
MTYHATFLMTFWKDPFSQSFGLQCFNVGLPIERLSQHLLNRSAGPENRSHDAG